MYDYKESGIKNLAHRIVLSEVQNYCEILISLSRVKSEHYQRLKLESETWLKSQWCYQLCEIDGERMINEIKKDPEEVLKRVKKGWNK